MSPTEAKQKETQGVQLSPSNVTLDIEGVIMKSVFRLTNVAYAVNEGCA
jgi:hypothetical protein